MEAMNTEKVLCVPTQAAVEAVGKFNVLCYQRKGGGEKRLDAKLSIGFGGLS